MRLARPAIHPARRQRGAALLTAMIIVTLVATLAASMVWQQWRAVQVEAAERARAQAAWILSGALDFGRLILKETVRPGKPTALTDPWATPLAEARLSTFLAADKASADAGPEAFLSGSITDAQSRYNLNNLVAQGKVEPLQIEILERLCQTVGVEVGVATRIANGLRDASATSAASGSTAAAAPLLPKTLAQLSWLGVDATSIEALRPHVALLPAGTPVNVNTAPREVLAAAVKGLDLATAERLVQVRQRTPFKDVKAFQVEIGSLTATATGLAVSSSYFEVRARLRLDDRVLVERSLVQRLPGGGVNVLQRERVAGLEQVGP